MEESVTKVSAIVMGINDALGFMVRSGLMDVGVVGV